METNAAPEVDVLPLRPPPEGKLTFEEFLAWVDEDEHRWAEWIDGEVVVLAPASFPHQQIQGFLLAVMRVYAQTHGLGDVLGPPFLIRMRQIRRGREPDLLFVATEHFHRFRHVYLDGPAELVVEIVSPDTRRSDRVDKPAEYAAAGVPEYWLIDPQRRQADFFRLGPDGAYVAVPADDAGVYRSATLPGFWLRTAWLWDERPDCIVALRALGLLAVPEVPDTPAPEA